MILKLIASLLGKLFGWLFSRHQAAVPAKAAANQSKAEADAGAIRDEADAQIEASREATDEAIRATQHDLAAPDGVRRGAADVQRAIDQANRGVR